MVLLFPLICLNPERDGEGVSVRGVLADTSKGREIHGASALRVRMGTRRTASSP